MGEYNEISKLELHEVTICEKGINPEARFDILKQDKGERNMSEKLAKALEELDALMEEVNTLRKEEEEQMDDEKAMNPRETEMMDDEKADDSELMEMSDEEMMEDEKGNGRICRL